MRKSWFQGLAVAVVLASNAPAQEGDLFTKLDKNTDGQVSAEEVEGDAKGIFERLIRNGDENKDGKLSKEEFGAAMRKRQGGEAPAGERPPGGGPRINPEEMFKRADANGDGKISKEEAPDRLKQGFDRIDADSDGAIDKQEFTKAMERLMAAAGGPPGAGPGGPAPRPEFLVGAMVLKALDADGNGEISASEITDAPKALAKFDKNSDGKLDKEELLAQAPREDRPGPGEGRPGLEAMMRRLKEADANGDGKLSKEEAPERLQQVFERIDGNKDGQVDSAELREFFAKAAANQQ